MIFRPGHLLRGVPEDCDSAWASYPHHGHHHHHGLRGRRHQGLLPKMRRQGGCFSIIFKYSVRECVTRFLTSIFSMIRTHLHGQLRLKYFWILLRFGWEIHIFKKLRGLHPTVESISAGVHHTAESISPVCIIPGSQMSKLKTLLILEKRMK